jgi:hypothetical protein
MSKPYRPSGSQTGPGDSSPPPSLQEALSQTWGPVRSVGATTFACFRPYGPYTIPAHSDDGRLIANIILTPDGQTQIIFHTSDSEQENATVRFDARVLTDEAAGPVPFTEGEAKLSPREGACQIEPPERGGILLVRFAFLDR